MSGANYFISVRQVLEAQKSIRAKSLLKHSDMKIIDSASAMVPIVAIESSENAFNANNGRIIVHSKTVMILRMSMTMLLIRILFSMLLGES